MQLRTNVVKIRGQSRGEHSPTSAQRVRSTRKVSELETLATQHATLVECLGGEVVVRRVTALLNSLSIEDLQAERTHAKELLRAIQRLQPGCGYPVIAHGGLHNERISPRMRWWISVQDELLQAGLV